MINFREFDPLVRAAAEQRRQQRPRNRRELADRIYTLAAIHLAADHYSAGNPHSRGVEPSDRVMNLIRNDPFFVAKLDALHVNLMQTLEDYAAQTGLDLK